MDDQHHHTQHHSETHHHTAHKLPAYSALTQVEEPLEEYLGVKAPQLPQSWRKAIAKYGPWITLVVLVLTLPLLLAAIGISAAVLPFASVVGYHHYWTLWGSIGLLLTMASLVLEVIALPALFKLDKKGWVLIFYAALIVGISNILMFDVGGILGSIISLYIIFQIKGQYK